MPSLNWREVADNLFGACCCSFDSISEKLVTRYVNSHTSAQGMCLLSFTSVTFCKDDLVETDFPERCGQLHGCGYVACDFGIGVVSEGIGKMGIEADIEDKKWSYTWEAQTHTPILLLLLFPFSKTPKPSLQHHNPIVHLHSPPTFLTLTSSSLSLRVPIPNVLLDAELPPTLRSFTDHIEIKLLLLLPFDHSHQYLPSSKHKHPTFCTPDQHQFFDTTLFCSNL